MTAKPRESDDEELKPLDPKAASRAIKRHIEKKRATEIRRQETGARKAPENGDPEAKKSPSTEAGKKEPAESPSPPASGGEELLRGIPIRNRDLIVLMEDSAHSLMAGWILVQTGENAQKAVPVSRAEMEFLLLKRSLLE